MLYKNLSGLMEKEIKTDSEVFMQEAMHYYESELKNEAWDWICESPEIVETKRRRINLLLKAYPFHSLSNFFSKKLHFSKKGRNFRLRLKYQKPLSMKFLCFSKKYILCFKDSFVNIFELLLLLVCFFETVSFSNSLKSLTIV